MKASHWKDVSCASVQVGDILRVKLDAYSTKGCAIHNGRIVKVVDVRNGDIHVTTIDCSLPFIKEARHSPYKLEKAVS